MAPTSAACSLSGFASTSGLSIRRGSSSCAYPAQRLPARAAHDGSSAAHWRRLHGVCIQPETHSFPACVSRMMKMAILPVALGCEAPLLNMTQWCSAGSGPVCDRHPPEHLLRVSGCHDRGRACRRSGRPCCRLHRGSAGWIPHLRE